MKNSVKIVGLIVTGVVSVSCIISVDFFASLIFFSLGIMAFS